MRCHWCGKSEPTITVTAQGANITMSFFCCTYCASVISDKLHDFSQHVRDIEMTEYLQHIKTK